MPSSEMASMALLSRSRRFEVSPAVPRESARRDTPLYRLKTPSQQVAMVLSARAFGLDASAAERVFGYRQATSTSWLTRAGRHAENLHEHCFRNLHIPHLQLDHCCAPGCAAPHRCVFLWLAIDPRTKILPVLSSSSPHTTCSAPTHSLPATDPGSRLSAALHQWRAQSLLLCGSRLTLVSGERLGRPGRNVQKTAGRTGLDLRPGEEKLTFGAS